jgi:light-regulated signal transduction histidine kinase (bacteriophytochrome)
MMPAPKPAQPAVPRTDAELSEFLLRACHDLRGPLRSIRAHTELLIKHGVEQPIDFDQSLGFVVTGAAQASLLVDALTDYSLAVQIEPASFRPVPMEVILRAVLAKLAGPLKESGAAVTYDSLPSASGNADRLMQLFEYLLDNAVRHHGPEPPRIHITAERQHGEWLFAVRDNGPGVEGEFLEKIFRPFERIHVNQRPGPGLATCRAIVERHGGTIWAEPGSGGGCIFYFTLPAE